MRHTIHDYLHVPKTWPVVEKIKHEIVLFPNKADAKKAKRKDPLACALHNAACRMFDIPNCAIGGRWAYIPQKDAKGKFYIARVQATQETQRAIRNFDRTGTMPLGGFRFIAIAPSHTYKKKDAYNKKRASLLHNKRSFCLLRLAPMLASFSLVNFGGTMIEGRAIVESSSEEGVMEAIEVFQCQFHNVTATIPVMTNDGRFISSVIYSNDTTIMEVNRAGTVAPGGIRQD